MKYLLIYFIMFPMKKKRLTLTLKYSFNEETDRISCAWCEFSKHRAHINSSHCRHMTFFSILSILWMSQWLYAPFVSSCSLCTFIRHVVWKGKSYICLTTYDMTVRKKNQFQFTSVDVANWSEGLCLYKNKNLNVWCLYYSCFNTIFVLFFVRGIIYIYSIFAKLKRLWSYDHIPYWFLPYIIGSLVCAKFIYSSYCM